MHNPDSVLENETEKVHWDFKVQADHIILTRNPDLVIVNKKKERKKKETKEQNLCCELGCLSRQYSEIKPEINGDTNSN